jgi:hypothetical protein
METNSQLKLWRVSIRSRYNYDAPSRLVEAKTKVEAHKKVQGLNLRLLDFPEIWSFHVEDTKKEFNSKKGKWI